MKGPAEQDMGGTVRRAMIAGAAALALALSGCVADQTGAGKAPGVVAEAPRAPRTERAGGEQDHARLVAAFGGEYRAPQAQTLLAEVTHRLVRATERPDETYEVTILNSPAINAFALPNGRLYATRGLLALANDTSELAAVMAHEIAHVTLRHAVARTELALRSALVSRVVSDVLNDPTSGALLQDQSRFALASFSRAQELEADQAGVRTLARAGYDPYGAVRFLASLNRNGSTRADASAPDMLATHPGTPERVALATQAARRVGAPGIGTGERARYLEVLEGIAFGDNPQDGVVRGRRFVHPRLGVSFEAPPGLSLENTSRAVLGQSQDGSRRLLFDAVEPQPGQGLEEVLRQTWSEAVETSKVETTEIHGFPAATATSRGKEWAFRLAAVRMGPNTFRLITAARSEADAQAILRPALDSLRPVAPEEAASLQPLRIRIVTAAPGDTVESLAARMAGSDRALERFLVLNGLQPNAALAAGQAYKVLVE